MIWGAISFTEPVVWGAHEVSSLLHEEPVVWGAHEVSSLLHEEPVVWGAHEVSSLLHTHGVLVVLVLAGQKGSLYSHRLLYAREDALTRVQVGGAGGGPRYKIEEVKDNYGPHIQRYLTDTLWLL